MWLLLLLVRMMTMTMMKMMKKMMTTTSYIGDGYDDADSVNACYPGAGGYHDGPPRASCRSRVSLESR
jgi:hypothetical protein